jgi:hypothetical protein
MGGQRHAPATLPPGKWPGTHFAGGWAGLEAGLDVYTKFRPQLDFETQIIQPEATRYTAAIPPASSRSYAHKGFPFEIALAASFGSLSWFILWLSNVYVSRLSPNQEFMNIKPRMFWKCLDLKLLGAVAICRGWGQFVMSRVKMANLQVDFPTG